jgi:spoIIIJ-associated protein
VGYAPARVRAVAARPDAPPFPREDEPEDASLVRELLQRVAAGIGVSCDVRVEEGDAEIRAELVGGDLGLVIGRHGQTIDAIQYLANAAVHRRYGADRRAVTVDAGGYRSRRSASLHRLAGSVAERVAATGRPATLEPMTAVERKIVHEYLKDDPEVETESDGTEPNRHVVVLPRRPL